MSQRSGASWMAQCTSFVGSLFGVSSSHGPGYQEAVRHAATHCLELEYPVLRHRNLAFACLIQCSHAVICMNCSIQIALLALQPLYKGRVVQPSGGL